MKDEKETHDEELKKVRRQSRLELLAESPNRDGVGAISARLRSASICEGAAGSSAEFVDDEMLLC